MPDLTTKIEEKVPELISLAKARKYKRLLVEVLGGMGALIALLLKSIKDYPVLKIPLVVSIVLWAIFFVLWVIILFKEPSTVADEPPPKAVKGLEPFTEDDGELFQKLWRSAEVTFLAQHVRNAQTSLVILLGEAGSGKTSILRAGLRNELKEFKTDYWPAEPHSTIEELEAFARTQLGAELKTGSVALEQGEKFRVLIIDQFEFLRPDHPSHKPFFTALETLCNRQAPHPLKVVIAFREDYSATWASEQPRLHVIPPAVPLYRLNRRKAQEVMATLLEQGGIKIDRATLDRYTSRVDNDGVLSLAIGIATSIFDSWARRSWWSSVNVKRYLKAGGATGVAADHFKEQFHFMAKNHVTALVKSLSANLIDPLTCTAKPEGASVGVLATSAELDPQLVNGYLQRLSSTGARIVERVATAPTEDRYRLAYEGLPEILRQGYESYLLAATTQDVRRKHLNQSRRHRFMRHRLIWTLVGLASILAIVAGGYFRIEKFLDIQQQNALAAGGLPRDLYTFQNRLDSLYIENSSVHNLEWLRAPQMLTLSVSSTAWSSLAGLNRAQSLQTLTLDLKRSSLQHLTEIAQLSNLKHLNLFLGGSQVQNLNELSQMNQLETLSVSLNNTNIDFAALGKLTNLHILTLDLSESAGQNLQGLSKLTNIQNLTLILDNSSLKVLPDLSGLTALTQLTLSLKDSRIRNIDSIASLRQLQKLDLNLANTRGIQELPDISSLHDLQCLALDLASSQVLHLPRGLTTLSKLQTLTLNLRWALIQAIPDLRPLSALTTLSLDLQGSNITSLPQLKKPNEGLERFDLSVDSLTASDLQELQSFKFLNEFSFDMTSFEGHSLPAFSSVHDLRILTLRSTWTELKSFPKLPGLNSLTLYISGALSAELTSKDAAAQLGRIMQSSNVTNLELYLEDSEIKKLPVLGRLNSLGLHLRRSQIEDLTSLAELTQLTNLSLNLEGCDHMDKLPDFGSLDKLENISLTATRSRISDLSGLKDANHLHTLVLDLHESKVGKLPNADALNRVENVSFDLRNTSINDLTEVSTIKEVTIGRNAEGFSKLLPSVPKLNFGEVLPDNGSSNCP